MEHMTTRQAAAHIRVGFWTLHKWRQTGKGPPFYRLGNSIRYRRADLDAWLESCRVEPKAEATG